jgi:hypothetical protein
MFVQACNTGLENKMKHMKKVILVILAACLAMMAFSQLNVNLTVSPTPPGSLLAWNDKREVLTFIVVYRLGSPRQAKIKAEFKLTDGTVIGTTDLARARTITFADGTNLFYAADVIPLDVMIFSGKYKTSLEKFGKLPADNYQLCVTLVEPATFAPMTQQVCRNFFLAAFQLPIPTMPTNEMILDLDKTKATIMFRWTPVSPRPSEMLTYRIMAFEVMQNQTPMQALRSNKPVLTKDVVGTTQYIWQHQLGFLPCCTDGTADSSNVLINGVNAYAFIWTLQTLDSQGRPFVDGHVNGDGISEPSVFLIDRRPVAMRRSGAPSKIVYQARF